MYGHRGPTFNNQIQKDFRPTIKIKNNKDKSFVFPIDWKSSNSTRITKQNYNRTFNGNFNKSFNKHNNTININKNNKINKNIKTNRTSKKPK